MRPGVAELVIILIIVLLIFGAGRIRKVFGELGGGVAEFRRGLREGQTEADVNEIKNDDPVIRQ